MKKIIRTGMILCSFLLASIAWALAWAEEGNQTNGVTITSDLSQALVNQETVYSVTTTKGSYTGGNVRVTVTSTGETNLSDLTFWYYEPNGKNPGWKEWNPVEQGFGAPSGFPLIDGTSYFKVQPTTAGEYTYTMSVVTVVSESEQSQTLAEATCTVKAVETLTAPYASITTTGESATTVNYASIPDAMRFVEEGQTINLSAGTFTLSTPLTITKAITIKGDDSKSVIEAVTNKENFTPITVDTKKDYNLVTIGGDGTGSVKLENLRITGSHGSGLNVQTGMKTYLDKVQLYNNANAGLLVHSEVEAQFLETEDNKWGGVNIDKGSTDYKPKLTIESNGYNFKENAKIWAEKVNCPNPYETVIIKQQDSHLTYKWAVVEGKGGEKWDTDMIYWVTTDKPKNDSNYTTIFVSDYSTVKDSEGNPYYNANFYANGNQVKVVAKDEHYTKIVNGESEEDFIVLPYQNRASLYGGANNATVNNTTITMTGGQLARIYGGGYGSSAKAKANVSGTAQINISGGTITGLVCGGGYKFAKTGSIDVNITGNDTKVQCLYAGGFSDGAQESLQTRWDDVVCGAKTVSINISNATLVEGFGCGGGQGYTYTGSSNVSVTNAKLGSFYGTLSNGYADRITATMSGCSFNRLVGWFELGTINRGTVGTASFTFDRCTFPSSEQITTFTIGAIEGWGDSDTKGDPAPAILGSVSYTFTDCTNVPNVQVGEGVETADVTLTGAPALLKKFRRGTNVTEDKGGKEKALFKIASGKTWAFNGGLAKTEDVTLNKQGKLIVGVATEEALQAAVALDADTIKLAAKEFKLSQQLLLEKTVALVGTISGTDSTKLVYSDSFKGGTAGNSKHMINVQANNVLLQNLVVDGTDHNTDEQANSGSAINVYKATGVVLDNVIARNTIAAGLIVNGSTVTATNFHTEGNGWYGVNVDKGDGVEGTPVFRIGDNCSFAENVAIFADLKNAPSDDPSKYVVSSDWIMQKVTTGTSESALYKWVNLASQGINYAIISVPATVVYGEANLPLIANVESSAETPVSFKIISGEDYVSIKSKEGEAKYDSLEIKKPGEVVLGMTVGDVTISQQLNVLKRTITVSEITANEKTYDGTTDVTLNTKLVKIEGYKGKTATPLKDFKGTLSSKNAGDAVAVNLEASFTTDTEKDLYELVFAPVTAKVNKKELTVTTASIDDIDYGKPLPTFTATYSGFVTISESEGENESVLNGTLQFDCPATSTSLAGDYTVTPYGLTSNNYAIKYKGTTLTINAVEPTVEIVSATVSNNNSTVTVKGHVTNNGGTTTTDLKGGFMVGEEVKAPELKVDENGYFEKTLEGLSGKISIVATAGAGSLSGSSAATEVDLSKTAQNVRFVTNLTRLVYGSKVTLAAADYADGAEVKFAVSEGGVLTLDETDGKTITAAQPGTATITVTATKVGYITATAKQTVVVEPKSVKFNPSSITKPYDGTLGVSVNIASVEGLLITDQNIRPEVEDVTYRFLDKNVGTNKPVVLSGLLKLTGENADCYTVIQPTDWTGSITSGGNVIVTVSDVHRKYNESALHYSLNFTVNGKAIDPIYTGSITVTENRSNGTWTASLNDVQFPNYGTVSLVPTEGPVNIEKGTPKVLTHHNSDGSVTGSVVDTEGWTDVTADGTGTDTNGTFAKFTYDRGSKSVRGVSLSRVTFNAHDWNISDEMRSARMLRAGSDAEQITFGQKKVLTRVDGFTYSVSNPAVVTLTEKDNSSYYINAVGVGDAAVIATHSGGTVVYKQIHVSPAELTISASNANKTYDGTTVANPSLTIEEAPAGVALDLIGISFNYEQANAGTSVAINPTQPIALTGANAANYQVSMSDMTGTISPRALTVTSPISKYYDGIATLTLTDYNATGLLVGEAAPAIKVTFADAKVGTNKELTWPTTLANSNYTLAGKPDKGNIVRSTIDAKLPASAPSADALKQRVTLTVRETGATVNWNTIGYDPTITTTGNGATYYISGGDTENYAVVYSSNQLGYGADPVIPGGGGGTVDPEPEIPTVSNPVVAERTATTAAITWEKVSGATSYKLFLYAKKTDSTPLKTYEFDKDGKLKATTISFTLTGLEEGKSYYIETAAYNALGTLLVKKSVELSATPTGIEAISEGSQLYTVKGAIVVAPAEPLQVAIYSVTGQTLFNDEVSYLTQVPAKAGIYVVVIQKGNERITEKVFVK